MSKTYPCDGPEMRCPFDAHGGLDCRNYCGLGVVEDENYYDRSDYEPDEQ